MPKSKPDQVIVHRIELNNKEREFLEEYVQSKSAENLASAAKNALIPVGVVFIGGVAYFIADGIHNIWEKQRDRIAAHYTKVKERVTDPSFERAKEDTGSWWRVFDIQYILGIK